MSEWNALQGTFFTAVLETLQMAIATLLVGGVLGLVLGVLLVTTRRGGLLEHPVFNTVLNVIVNIVRPIPFVILIAAIAQQTQQVMGTTIGVRGAIFPLAVAATFGVSRIVEQNLVAVDPGVIEAAQAMGASPWQIIKDVLVREALGPLILGYTFLFVAIVDMTAIAGAVGGGGLGDFAITYGYHRFNWEITWIAVAVIVLLVQAAQFTGNGLARKAMRR